VLSKLTLGTPLESRDVRDGATLMLLDLPDAQKLILPKPEGAEFNFHSEYYWYYGTLVMWHMGGEYWNTWKERIIPVVKETQNTTGAAGSWDPKDEFLGQYAGRVYATVFNILNLEIFYRFLPLYKTREVSGRAPAQLKTLDQLLEEIRSNRDRGVLGVVEDLGMRFGKDPKALEALGGVLIDPRFGNARHVAYNALMKNRKEALPTLRRAFLQVDDTFKRAIMAAFRQEKDREAVRVLEIVANATDGSKSMRAEAAALLKELKK
jgi:hypothetical protein